MIRVINLEKEFKGVKVLNGINLDIYDGEKIAIIGPSGCGKSTFLRCLNLLETPNEGVIEFDGEVVYIREAYGLKEELSNLKKNKESYPAKEYKSKYKL